MPVSQGLGGVSGY